MHTVREGRSGDMGGGGKSINSFNKKDKKAGFKEHDDGNPKYGKEGKKKDAEQKARKSFKS